MHELLKKRVAIILKKRCKVNVKPKNLRDFMLSFKKGTGAGGMTCGEFHPATIRPQKTLLEVSRRLF
jgi:hypothetical protein